MKEAQKQLYQWREEFFHKNFKSVYFGADKKDANWISFGFDDTHIFDTVPFQITQNFKEVLKLSSTKKVLESTQYERFYFEDNEELSRKASSSFEIDGEEAFWLLHPQLRREAQV